YNYQTTKEHVGHYVFIKLEGQNQEAILEKEPKASMLWHYFNML
ncbi:15720_t:CDS:1, partial [Racocetra persica]